MKEEEAKEAKEGAGARRDIILDIIILEFAGRARWEGGGLPLAYSRRWMESPSPDQSSQGQSTRASSRPTWPAIPW